MIDSKSPIKQCAAILARAKHGFQGRNNDELSFQKGDVITVTQQMDGGWWEGTLNDKTGWFPSDYTTILTESDKLLRSKSSSAVNGAGVAVTISSNVNMIQYRAQILKEFMDEEAEHIKEMHAFNHNLLQPLKQASCLKTVDLNNLIANIGAITGKHQELLSAMKAESSKSLEAQRIGGLLLRIAPSLKQNMQNYCTNHPCIIETLNAKQPDVQSLMSKHGSNFQSLIAALSKPFRQLDRFPSALQELERTMEGAHPDRGDAQRACAFFRELTQHCAWMRQQKEMQLEFQTAAKIGDGKGGELPTASFGQIIHLGTTTIGEAPSIDSDEPIEPARCLALFSSALLILEITPIMNRYELKEEVATKGLVVQRSDAKSSLKLTASGSSKPLHLNLLGNDDMQRWLDAFVRCRDVKIDESCATILPSVPLKYDVGNLNMNELSPLKQVEISQMPSATRAEQVKKANFSDINPFQLNHELEMFIPEADENTASATKRKKDYSGFCLRPYPAARGKHVYDFGKKTPVKMRKGASASDQDDAEILRVIEAYCSTPTARHARNNNDMMMSGVVCAPPQLIVAEDEKILVEELVGDQVIMQEKSLVDTVYVLRDQIGAMQKEIGYLMKAVSKEQKARRRLEENLRRGNQQPQRPEPLAPKNVGLDSSD